MQFKKALFPNNNQYIDRRDWWRQAFKIFEKSFDIRRLKKLKNKFDDKYLKKIQTEFYLLGTKNSSNKL